MVKLRHPPGSPLEVGSVAVPEMLCAFREQVRTFGRTNFFSFSPPSPPSFLP